MWPGVLNARLAMEPLPAVYAILHEQQVNRLRGSSRMLYVGSTGELGGASDRCRLRIYRYPNGGHARQLRRRLELLTNAGTALTFVWRHVDSKRIAMQQEAEILADYMAAHWELPPFNARP
jgi:hypothetical protein